MKLIKILFFLFISVLACGAAVPVIDFDNSFIINHLKTSYDGAYIYAAVSDGTLRRLDASSGRELDSMKFNGHIRSISPAKDSVLVLADKLYMVDFSNGICRPYNISVLGVISAVSDRTGDFAAGVRGRNIIYYNLISSTPITSIPVESELYSITVCHSRRLVFVGGKDGVVRGFSIDSGEKIFETDINIGVIRSVDASSDTVIVGGENGAAAVDLNTEKVKVLPRHFDDVRSVAITPDGKFAVSGGDDTTAVLWNMSSFKADNIPLEQKFPVKAVAIDPYFRYVAVSAGEDGGHGGLLHLQYTANKSQLRKTYFYRDASLTVDKIGYVDGLGLFGKYISYKDGVSTYSFSEAADVVHKPEKLIYSMPYPKLPESPLRHETKTVPIDTEPPVISLDQRGFMQIAEDDILVITGTITDDSAVAWAKLGANPLTLTSDGRFKIELANDYDGSVVISAADIYGNGSEKIIKVSDKGFLGKANKKNKALLIGINSYQHLGNLTTPEYDCHIVAELLKGLYGYDVTLITGKNATRDAIMSEISNIRRTANKDDNIIIYYAGHGYKDPDSGNVYWQPYDARSDNDAKWILTSQITSSLVGFKSDNIVIISDSCYSGVAEPINDKRSRILISSGSDEPVADKSGTVRHSLFTGALIEALKDRADNSYELYDKIMRHFPKGLQTPKYIKLSGENAKI